MREIDIAFLKKTWLCKEEISGLGGIRGELIYNRNLKTSRTNLTVIKSRTTSLVGAEQIIIGSTYLPYDSSDPSPTREEKKLVRTCRADG